MPWWGWMVVGAALLGAEMFVIDAQFYLVFLGIAAALVGLAMLAGFSMPEWGQWLAFAIIAVASMLTFRRRLYQRLRRPGGDVDQRLTIGDRISVPTRLEPDGSCRVDYRGTTWTARNVGTTTIDAGGHAEIVEVDRLILKIRPAS